ncbi:hypothetical protein C8J57DRAFT_1547263 [Mycena rebaudengoi]|nr:hypothetical protein C8J57DRAFT_1547263 [Mycena rebaudengoi]
MTEISTQWRSLTVIANNDRFLDLLRDLPPLDAPILSDFCIFSVAASSRFHDNYRSPFMPTIFGGQLSALVSFTTLAFAVNWSHQHLFLHLETLELRNIPPSGYPTSAEFISAITHSPSLHTLILDTLGVRGPCIGSIKPFALPSVKVLELNFSPADTADTKALIHIMSFANLPLIRTLTLANAGNDAMADIALHINFLDQIQTLILLGCIDPEPSLLQVMRKFTNVQLFDASMVIWPTPTTFTSQPQLLPHLERLVVGPMPILALAAYVQERQKNKTNRLHTIIYHHRTTQPLTEKQRKALHYMTDALQSFSSFPNLL